MRERFEELLAEAQEAYVEGQFERSAELFETAERLATVHGDAELADRAFCNRCPALMELDRALPQIPRLKRILLSTQNPRNRFLAAFYSAAIAVSADGDQDLDQAARYANRAMALAEALGEPEAVGRAANLAGTIALRRSDFEEAEVAYRRTISLHHGDGGYRGVMEALEKDNLGYVLLSTDRISEGVRLCEEAQTALESSGAEHFMHQVLQDLCYGYLLDDQLDKAESCGERALELAIDNDDPLVVKNCLFLLGETAVRRGDAFRARRRLRELAGYFPEIAISEEVVDVLLATDMTSVVNLRG